MGFRQKVHLLHGKPYTFAEQTARSKGLKGVGELEPYAQRIFPGVEKSHDPLESVADLKNQKVCHHRNDHGQRAEQVKQGHACSEHHSPADHAHDHDGAEIGLAQDESGHEAEHHGMGHNANGKFPQFSHFLFFGQGVGHEKDHGKLGKFCGLECEQPEIKPASGIVGLNAESRDKHGNQKADGCKQDDISHAFV